jgi:hypothetical protein
MPGWQPEKNEDGKTPPDIDLRETGLHRGTGGRGQGCGELPQQLRDDSPNGVQLSVQGIDSRLLPLAAGTGGIVPMFMHAGSILPSAGIHHSEQARLPDPLLDGQISLELAAARSADWHLGLLLILLLFGG